jgi:hypothetical protein
LCLPCDGWACLLYVPFEDVPARMGQENPFDEQRGFFKKDRGVSKSCEE